MVDGWRDFFGYTKYLYLFNFTKTRKFYITKSNEDA